MSLDLPTPECLGHEYMNKVFAAASIFAEAGEVDDFSRFYKLCKAVLKGEDVTRFHNSVIRAVREFGQPLGVYRFAHEVALARIRGGGFADKPQGNPAGIPKPPGR